MASKVSRRSVLAATVALNTIRLQPAQATPEAATDACRLPVDWVPGLPADSGTWPSSLLVFSDIAGYFAARKIDHPGEPDEANSVEWQEVLGRLPLGSSPLFQFAMVDWVPLAGFSPWLADGSLQASEPPDSISIISGAFEPDRISERLLASGYSARFRGEFTVLDRPTDAPDLADELQRYVLGAFNHVAVSPSSLIAAPTVDHLESIFAVIAGEAESLGEMPELGALLDVAAEMQGAWMMSGAVLAPAPFETVGPLSSPVAIETSFASDDPILPRALAFLAGISVDGDQPPAVSFVADLVDPELAREVAPIVAKRLETGVSVVTRQPWSVILGPATAGVVPGTGLVRVQATGDLIARRWQQVVASNDLGFIRTG
jgi:hypothetical protein